MKVFVLVSRIPFPLEKGDKLRSYHQVKELHKRHEVFLCCLSAEPIPDGAHEALQEICSQVAFVPLIRWRILTRLMLASMSSRPFQVHYFLQRSARKSVHTLIERFAPDHIYCQLVRCSEYVKHLYTIPKTLDYMDAMNKGMERLAGRSPWYISPLWRIESRRLVRYENLIYDYFDRHTIISKQDQQLIHHPRRQAIQVVPNGVDTSFFEPKGSDAAVYDVVFTGNMSYPPNVDTAEFLAREVMPLVRAEHPKATLLLAGASPHSRVKNLANELTIITGWLDDIRDAYRQATVFVAPMRIGTGLQNKLLEAMSMQVPCVTSRLANNALGATHNEHLMVANGAHETAEAIVHLLNDQHRRLKIAEAGRQFVVERFSWEASSRLLEDVFKETDQ